MRWFPLRWAPYVAYRQASWLVDAARRGPRALGTHLRGLAAAVPRLAGVWRARQGPGGTQRAAMERAVPARPWRGPAAGGHRRGGGVTVAATSPQREPSAGFFRVYVHVSPLRLVVLALLSTAFAAIDYRAGLGPHDEGLMLQWGHRIASGEWPYRDFWCNYLPGAPLLQAVLGRLARALARRARGAGGSCARCSPTCWCGARPSTTAGRWPPGRA